MNIRFFVSTLFVLSLVWTTTGLSMLQQVQPAVTDSLKKVRLEEQQKILQKQLDSVKTALAGLRAKSTPDSARIAEAEMRIESLENELIDIRARLHGEAVSFDDEEWDRQFGEEEQDEEEDWSFSWKDESDEDQFSIRSNILKKYPGSFQWLFPLSTNLGETFFRYNRVEGVYIGAAQPKRLYWHSKPRIVGTGSLGYGFANHRWRYSLGLYFPFYLGDQIIEFGGEGHSFTDSKDQWVVDRDENTAMAFFAREDFMDYFGREGFSVSGSWYYRAPGSVNLKGTIAYLHDTYETLNRRTNWSLFGGDKVFRRQPMINNGNINSLLFSAGFSTTPNVSRSQIGWSVQAAFETAGGFAKGDYEFQQMTLDVRRYQPVADFLNINVRFRGTASDGLLPLQRSVEIGGISTLPGYRYKEFGGTHAALFNLEFILRSGISDNTRGWISGLLSTTNLILFADAGAVNPGTPQESADFKNGMLSSSFSNNMKFDDWNMDAGVAIGSRDGNFRIGAAWRLDRAESPNFILRFSRPF